MLCPQHVRRLGGRKPIVSNSPSSYRAVAILPLCCSAMTAPKRARPSESGREASGRNPRGVMPRGVADDRKNRRNIERAPCLLSQVGIVRSLQSPQRGRAAGRVSVPAQPAVVGSRRLQTAPGIGRTRIRCHRRRRDLGSSPDIQSGALAATPFSPRLLAGLTGSPGSWYQ